MLTFVSILGGCLVGLIALIGVFVAWRQSVQTRAIHVAETRPYVVPEIIDGTNRDGKESLYLRLENHGKTPAMRIHVEFLTDARWHNVSRPSSFPFHRDTAGIPLLAPKAHLEFFLGEKSKGAEFIETLEDGVDVRVTFKGLIQETPHSDTYAVTARNKFARHADSK